MRTSRRRGRPGKPLSSIAGFALIALAILVAAAMQRQGMDVTSQAAVLHPQVVSEFDTVQVPVPEAYVPVGAKLSEVRFKWVRFPEYQVPAEAVRNLDEVREAVAIAPLPANLPLFRANLSIGATLTNPVIERIPSGMRAMTIRVDETSSVEGWAGSGSVVDVLLVQAEKTTVIAERVKILSAARSVAPVEGSAVPTVPSTVTLLVSQEQCLAINTAIPLGKIAFALRSAKDEETWNSPTFSADALRGRPSSPGERHVVSGYAAVRDEKGERLKGFALADGRWVTTDALPEGMRIEREPSGEEG